MRLLRRQVAGRVFALWAVMMMLPTTSESAQASRNDKQPEISDLIQAIEAEHSPMARANDAHELMASIKRAGAKNVTDPDIAAMMRLLKKPDDPARYWVAVALGDMGPRAASAVPALENALKQEACMMGSVTSTHVIRSAIEKIGSMPPPVSCPIVANGYENDVSVVLFNKGHASMPMRLASSHCIKVDPDTFVLTKLVVTLPGSAPKIYQPTDFRRALDVAHNKNGLFVVGRIGLTHVKEFSCAPL